MFYKLVGWALPTAAPKVRHSIALGFASNYSALRHAFEASESCARLEQAPDVAGCGRRDGGQCPPYGEQTRRSLYGERRGVILLVVMALLSLMTLMGLTLVLVTAQGRLSALAASRDIQPEQDDKELWSVTTQVVAGSTDPNSSFGAHGLLEDLYGLPAFFGQIAPQPAAPAPVLPLGGGQVAPLTTGVDTVASGQLLQLVVVAGNAYAKGMGSATQGASLQYTLPIASGSFCGQVITMLTGPAAGQSARVVGYFYDPNNGLLGGVPFATMQVSAFNGLIPKPSDQFVINGRPFSGTGFGLNLLPFQTGGGMAPYWQVPWLAPAATPPVYGNVPLLNAMEPASATVPAVPYAYLPNHARLALTSYAPTTSAGAYWDAAGPGGANEGYDAPDFQNLMLAMHYWNPTSASMVTPIPSLHRPELVGWYYNQAIVNTMPTLSMNNPDMRRKVILRPEPTDHFYNDLNGNGAWDAREPFYDANGTGVYDTTPLPADTFLDLNGNGVRDLGDTDYSGNMFNPVTGCWYIAQNGTWQLDTGALSGSGGQGGLDVDNDMDNIPDSIWVDPGLPVHKEADGTFTKNMAAVLCIDLDGKLNINAAGNLTQLDANRYNLNSVNAPVFYDSTGMISPKAQTSSAKGYTQTAGSVAVYSDATYTQRLMPVSQGNGPPDINLVHLFLRAQGGNAAAALNYYQIFLQGYANSTAPTPVPQFVDGRYGESSRLTQAGNTFPAVYPPGSYTVAGMTPPFTYTNQLFNGPRPGYSQWYDPFLSSTVGFDWVNDSSLLARMSDYRPSLLTPWVQAGMSAGSAPFFFDFLAGNTLNHVPTAHGTPSDLLARGFVGTDMSGHPYYAGTGTFPWLTNAAGWQTTMYDYAVNLYFPYPASWPAASQDLVLNEMVDTAYETNLTRQSARDGRNSGNNNYGSDFVSIESPLLPSELEGLLRSHEWNTGNAADSAGLAQRLNQLETAANYYNTGTPTALTTNLASDSVRLALTTESWDLPAPNIALTPQQIIDVVTYNNTVWGMAGTTSLNINSLGLVDLARARILTENLGNAAYTFPAAADLALFGNLKNVRQNVTSFPASPPPPVGTSGPPWPAPLNPPFAVWPLLAPETVLGMRLDVNRLLGNGQDDNGNGVVDEPEEVLVPGEKLFYPGGQVNPPGAKSLPVNKTTGNNTVWEWLDLNNDGFLPPITGLTDPQTGNPYPLPALPPDLSFIPADMRARQLLARHLYVTMMLLLDDRNMSAKVFDTMGAQGTVPPFPNAVAPYPMLPAWPNYYSLASLPAAQAAYVVAQWAVNVVDFRDRDSISTPFEFDIQPFVANDPTNPYVTWNVDDVVAPYSPVGNTISPDDLNPLSIRGLVWGCERPELLMTETVAFHDRGTDDTNNGEPPAKNQSDSYTNDTTAMPRDTDYDQVRRPRGSLIVELFNPTGYWDAPQLDMQYDGVSAAVGALQPWQVADGNGNMGVGVNLAQVAMNPTPPAGDPIASPVWRLAISYSPWWNESNFYTQWTNSPAGTSKSIDLRVPTLPPAAIHRAVYFAPYQASFVYTPATPLPGVTFTSANNNWVAEIPCERSFFADPTAFGATGARLLLPPGQYALVAPAVAPPTGGLDSLYIGQNDLSGAATSAANLNAQRLDLGGGGSSLAAWYNIAGGASAPRGSYSGIGTTIKPVIGVPIQTNWLTSTGAYVVHTNPPAGVQYTLRMSVSEPEHGYPVWPLGVATSITSLWDDGFYYTTRGNPNKIGTPPIPNFPQHPFDSGQSSPSGTSYLFGTDSPNGFVAPDGTTNGPNTTLGYTVVYLQRLANPLEPWDLYANPYITVDSMPVDLTAYTGENQPLANATLASATEPQTGYVNPSPGGNTVFDSRRRGYNALGALLTTSETIPDVWTPLPVSQPNPYDGASAQSFGITSGSVLSPLPTATLGYLNTEYSASGTWTSATAPVGTTGILGSVYAGDAQQGFPWIAWNNRPFISPYELMLVPASSPSSLPYDFGMIGWTGLGAVNEYLLTGVVGDKHKKATSAGKPKTGGTPTTITSAAGYLPIAQFGQLMNFFDSQQPGPSPSGSYLPNLFRVFEYLQVPSRFAGTQDMMNPTFFAGDNGAVTSGGAMAGASHLFHTPFNWLSRYRDPGRINLNTVFDPVVFQGLMDDYPGTVFPSAAAPSLTSLWTQMIYSRQGFSMLTTPDSVYPMNPPNPVAMFYNPPPYTNPLSNYPTYFANPFRPDGAGAFVPQTFATNPASSVLMQSWTYPNATGAVSPVYYGANATILRSQNPTGVNQYSSTPPGSIALFGDTTFDTTNLGATSPSAGNAYRNAAANDYFQYQMFTRLGNTTTNRSNVYAIWVTLGKFEVQPIGVNPNNPDGYRLIKPYLDATGNQSTTRGFYVFDRSIPMGFQRGQDLNIETGFLLERVLKESN